MVWLVMLSLLLVLLLLCRLTLVWLVSPRWLLILFDLAGVMFHGGVVAGAAGNDLLMMLLNVDVVAAEWLALVLQFYVVGVVAGGAVAVDGNVFVFADIVADVVVDVADVAAFLGC